MSRNKIQFLKLVLAGVMAAGILASAWYFWRDNNLEKQLVEVEIVQGVASITAGENTTWYSQGETVSIQRGNLLELDTDEVAKLKLPNNQIVPIKGPSKLLYLSYLTKNETADITFEDLLTGDYYTYSLDYNKSRINASVIGASNQSTPGVLGAIEYRDREGNSQQRLIILNELVDCLNLQNQNQAENFDFDSALDFCSSEITSVINN